MRDRNDSIIALTPLWSRTSFRRRDRRRDGLVVGHDALVHLAGEEPLEGSDEVSLRRVHRSWDHQRPPPSRRPRLPSIVERPSCSQPADPSE